MPQRNLTWVLLLAMTAALVYWLRPGPTPTTVTTSNPAPSDLTLFQEARNLVRDHSVDPGTDRNLQEGAIRGMVEALDPFSSYYPPELADKLAAQARGEYSGIGVELEPRDGRLVVLTRVEGSPAAAAEILPGDILVKIDGQDADTMRPEDAAQRLHGPPGSTVTVSVMRSGENPRITRTVTRALIEASSVRGWLRLPGGGWDWMVSHQPRIAYLRINSFLPRTVEELNHAVHGALRRGAAGLILDLRFNPGGQLTAAVESADLFLRQGVIVSQRQGTQQSISSSARAEGTLPPLPLVVLVNRFTASSAEVFAGALKENQRALVIGETTWGKGTIQTMIPLSNGGILKLTTARWYLPNGKSVHREPGAKAWGIEPHLTVVMGEEDYAQMLTRRERVDAQGLENGSTSRPASQPLETQPQDTLNERIAELLACDPQLSRAIEVMQRMTTQPASQPGMVDPVRLLGPTSAPEETPQPRTSGRG